LGRKSSERWRTWKSAAEYEIMNVWFVDQVVYHAGIKKGPLGRRLENSLGIKTAHLLKCTFFVQVFIITRMCKQCTFEEVGGFRANAISTSKILKSFHKAPKNMK